MIGQKIIIRRREPDQRRGGRDNRGYDRDRRSGDRGSSYGNRGRNDQVRQRLQEVTETTVAAEITEETAIEAVEAEPQIVTEAEALMIEEVVQTDQEIAAQATVEVETDTVQEALEALIEEEAVKAVVDLDKSAEEDDYRGKSGGARQSRDRDSDRSWANCKITMAEE